MSEHQDVIYEDQPDNFSAVKLVVLTIVTLAVAFGIIDFISDIGLKMTR